jgi:hypothetical protein
MPNPFHYRSSLQRLVRLTEAPNSSRVRLSAAITLANELRPGTPQGRLAERMLQVANPFEFARHKLRDLYDGTDPLVHVSAAGAAVACLEEEEIFDEPEDPL